MRNIYGKDISHLYSKPSLCVVRTPETCEDQNNAISPLAVVQRLINRESIYHHKGGIFWISDPGRKQGGGELGRGVGSRRVEEVWASGAEGPDGAAA
jgi:hypothetical protein